MRAALNLQSFTRGSSISQALRRPLGRTECAKSYSDSAKHEPVLPVCERPAQHVAELPHLRDFEQKALANIADVGDSWVTLDNGPSQEDLQTELNWLLDDAVAQSAQPPAWEWRAADWRSLQWLSGNADEAAMPHVKLRVSLTELEQLWRQRIQSRVPLQYLTNAAHWRDLVVAVGPGVLIPRPETELLVDFAAEALHAQPSLAAAPWLDLGTGSGAVALSASQLPGVAGQVYAVDVSDTAAAWARLNVRRLGLHGRVQVLQGSWFKPVSHLQGQVGVILSNPPYIDEHDMATLQAEVGRHEPHLALAGGGPAGLQSLQALCTAAGGMLRPAGFIALETAGGQQTEQVAELLRSCGLFQNVCVRQDMRQVRRFVTAWRL